MEVKLDKLLNQQGVWLRGDGPESSCVLSSRIRLARNFEGYSFVNQATEQDLADILARFRLMVEKSFAPEAAYYFDLRELSELDRYFLLERQLISREMAQATNPRAVLIDRNEEFSVMVNEEDHIRLQGMASGFNLESVWDCINKIDNQLSEVIPMAFDSRWGFLTACPSNIGTGIRVSVMLHLPGLVETGEVERVFRSLQKLNLTVRGMYGEGTMAMGGFFQISNQVTLGRNEEYLIHQVGEVILAVIDYEKKARERLLETGAEKLFDKCFRALGILRSARVITVEEAMEQLSRIRLGVALGEFEGINSRLLNDLLLHLQPSHLQKLAQRELNEEQANIFRAQCIREKLKGL